MFVQQAKLEPSILLWVDVDQPSWSTATCSPPGCFISHCHQWQTLGPCRVPPVSQLLLLLLDTTFPTVCVSPSKLAEEKSKHQRRKPGPASLCFPWNVLESSLPQPCPCPCPYTTPAPLHPNDTEFSPQSSFPHHR